MISIPSILQKVIPLNEILKKKLIISDQDKHTYEKILEFLNTNMYEKVEFVRNKGEFAVRGEIMDIFSPNEKRPVRICFNFEEIESLNFFNVEEQKSEEKTDKYCLFIASEILFNDSTIRNFRQAFRKIKISNKEDFYKSISNKIFLPGSEQFYPILFSNFDSIIDYFSDELIFIQSNFFTNYSDTYNKFINEFNEVNSSIIKESTFLQSKEELFESLEKKKIVVLYNYFIQDNEYFIFSED